MREIPKPGERYRHFKNKEYQILAVATHSETGEKMVVYQALYGEYGVWVRPLSMFMEEVDRVKYPEAAQRYRFERIAAGPWENSKQQEIRTTRTTHVVNEGVRRSKMSDAATHSWDIPQEEPELHPLVAEFLDQETTEKESENEAAQTEEKQQTYYLIKEVEDVVKVFYCDENGQEDLYQITTVPFQLLSTEDQQLLSEGVRVADENELADFLENFDS